MRKRSLSPVRITILSALCAALWLFLGFARRAGDPVTIAVGAVWLVSAVFWGLRALRAGAEEEKEEKQ